ncbi:RCC1/BLIP-II [Poronia punctata]|nr:RCC1/BLIP-II [Poronia punctata]
MNAYRTSLRHASLALRSTRQRAVTTPQQCLRYVSSTSNGQPKRSGKGRIVGLALIGLVAGGAVFAYPTATKEPEQPRLREAELEFEKARPSLKSKEESRDLLSSQHVQVKKSWENPGVYCWGSNEGKVAAPDSDEKTIKTPRRIAYFDGQLIRDIKLDKEFGAAVTEKGDLVQWGTGFSKENPTPTPTLKGKDLIRIEISRDRIVALGKSGAVYSLPVAAADQATSSSSNINYRELKPKGLGWGEQVTDISSGLEHVLLLTSKGRLFSAASSHSDFPSKGQLGVPGLTWSTRPQGPFDQPHEIVTLKDFKISQIAAGDYHSLALAKDGRVFVFGDNTSGQLGFEAEAQIPFVDGPVPLPISTMYRGTHLKPRITSIAAGGSTSFFTVDATRFAEPGEDTSKVRDLGRVTSDVWACGSGISGTLGNGKWTHVSLGPTKIKSMSGLSEYDEKSGSVVPIGLARLSAGSTHAAAVLKHRTNVDASAKTSDQDTNFGADVLWWGGNEHYQLGTGRRNNAATPIHIAPLEGRQGIAEKEQKGETNRFQLAPRTTTRIGQGDKARRATVEQRVECGRHVTAVYSAT